MIVVAPTESGVLTALRSFLLAILPPSIKVIQAQNNRVPEPASTDFVVMTPVLYTRLETNYDDTIDAVFTGSISGTTMTITAVQSGSLAVGNFINGVNVLPLTSITALGSGSGGVGTYTVSNSQTIVSETLASGTAVLTQALRMTVQLDVHGPNSSENASTISTLFRDSIAADFFLKSGYDVTPLYADDATQMPFMNSENQYELRWVINALLQVNEVISAQFGAAPLTFASQLVISSKPQIL